MWFFSVLPDICQDSTSNKATAVLFHFMFFCYLPYQASSLNGLTCTVYWFIFSLLFERAVLRFPSIQPERNYRASRIVSECHSYGMFCYISSLVDLIWPVHLRNRQVCAHCVRIFMQASNTGGAEMGGHHCKCTWHTEGLTNHLTT